MRNEPDPELPGPLPPEVLAPLKQGPLPPDALEEAVIADWRGRQPRFRRRRRARIAAPWLPPSSSPSLPAFESASGDPGPRWSSSSRRLWFHPI